MSLRPISTVVLSDWVIVVPGPVAGASVADDRDAVDRGHADVVCCVVPSVWRSELFTVNRSLSAVTVKLPDPHGGCRLDRWRRWVAEGGGLIAIVPVVFGSDGQRLGAEVIKAHRGDRDQGECHVGKGSSDGDAEGVPRALEGLECQSLSLMVTTRTEVIGQPWCCRRRSLVLSLHPSSLGIRYRF